MCLTHLRALSWRPIEGIYQPSLVTIRCRVRKLSTVIESCKYTFTFDLIWPLTYLCDLWLQNIMEANIGHLPTKFGYKQMQGWKVINRYSLAGKPSHLWPLTYLCDLWPQNIMEAIIGHLPTKFGYKQMQGWKVINRYSLAGKPSRLISFDLWPTYVTYYPRISWRPT